MYEVRGRAFEACSVSWPTRRPVAGELAASLTSAMPGVPGIAQRWAAGWGLEGRHEGD